MSKFRRITVSLPDGLLAELDQKIEGGKYNRSEFIREGLEYYMAELKRRSLAEGYAAMAALNLEIAQENPDDLSEYEQALSEGE
ncbi:MAG TPA: ribbon-helix-helix protein, CopG family [Firmicutes bacterium]|nr:ribbon-helix-helix protein, CopG family [Bacillota bacterium]